MVAYGPAPSHGALPVTPNVSEEILVKLDESTIDDNDVHPKNVLLPLISDRLVGRTIDDNEVQSRNVSQPLTADRLVGKTIDDNDEQ